MTSPLTAALTLTLTMTSYLDHDLDQDHDHDQPMHTIEARWAQVCGRGLAKSVAHGNGKTTDPGSGANTLTVTAHSAGSLREGAPGPCMAKSRFEGTA